MKDCPHKSTQFAGSQGQSSSSGGKYQSTKNQPRPNSGQKGDKGRGKGKGKKDVKKKLGNTSFRGKNKPSARALGGEEEEEPEYETENEEENEEENSEQPFVGGITDIPGATRAPVRRSTLELHPDSKVRLMP